MSRAEGKQKIKDQILDLLKTEGAQTAANLALRLHVSPMAIRQHLQQLQLDQWVTYQEERRPIGRPVKLWQLASRSLDRFPNSHAELMVELLSGVVARFGTEGLEQLIADRSQRQIDSYSTQLTERVPQSNWQQHVAEMAALRTQEGYMAEAIEQPDGTMLLIENHCPICVAAQHCPQLCGSELETFRAVLGTTVHVERIEHLLQGDRRCAYRISPVLARH